MTISLSSPINPGPIDFDNRFLDVLLFAIIIDGLLASGNSVIIIHDEIAADGQFRVKRDEAIHGRLVEIAIQARDGKLADRSSRKRILEPPLQKLHLFI